MVRTIVWIAVVGGVGYWLGSKGVLSGVFAKFGGAA